MTEMIEPGNSWHIKRLDPNAVTLDYCRLKLGDKPWSATIPVWKAHDEVSKAGSGEKFVLQYEFESTIDCFESGEMWFVIESPERFNLAINGEPLPSTSQQWWVDPSFKKIDIRRHVRKGVNTVAAHSSVKPDAELETAYLIGDFAVRIGGNNKPILETEEGGTVSGNLIDKGYPFFVGTLSLSQELDVDRDINDPLWIELMGLKSPVAIVLIDGEECGKIIWRPHRVKLQGLAQGRRTIEIRLINTLRNLLGPHHRLGPEPSSVGPNSFSDGANWKDSYSFVPNGFDRIRIYPNIEGNLPSTVKAS